MLEACPTARAADLLKITWDEADGIKQRAVRRGLVRRQIMGLAYVCVHEKAVGRGQEYVIVVTGVVGGKPKVLYIGDGRDDAALNGFWEWLGPEVCARIKALKDSTLKTARAWRLKELWRTFKRCLDLDDAHAFFHKWYVLAIQSKLEPVKKAAGTFKAHLAGIVTLFKHGFCNALAEGVNSRIQRLMQKACGYRNRQRLKTDILFHFGGLNMDPLAAQ